jgi:hypothetical protein
MTERPDHSRPPLLVGRQVPFGQLEWQEFEHFVRTVLIKLGPRTGLDVDAESTGSGDWGFDIGARRTKDNARVCIQCKRYAKNITTAVAAEELAKVALKSWLEGSAVREHYIISTGGVAENLRSACREEDRHTLIARAQAKAESADDLRSLREDVESRGGSVGPVARDYVRNLEKAVVWSGSDLDAEVTVIWSELIDVFERFFVVSSVLREHPRPDFDEAAHLARVREVGTPSYSVLLATQTAVPRGLRSTSATHPTGLDAASPGVVAPPTDVVEALVSAELGITVVSGDGGAGKTTALRQAAARQTAARTLSRSNRLPILVPLKGYGGNLDSLIHQAIDVVHGSWRSLPGEYCLLLDGLNEVAPAMLSQLERDLEALPWSRTAAAVSVRPSGTFSPVIIRELTGSLKLLEPGVSAVKQIAAGLLDSRDVPAFVAALYPRIASGRRGFLRLPFGISLAASVFREHGQLPESRHELLRRYLQARFTRNHENSRTVLGDMADLPFPTVVALAERVSYETFVRRNARQLPEGEMLEVLSLALLQVRRDSVFGASDIREIDIPRLLVHHDLLNVDAQQNYSSPHDIVVNWLSSARLAASWRQESSSLRTRRCDEAWLFAASRISNAEQDDFLDLMLDTDIVLAAECAVEIGTSAMVKVEQTAVRDLAVAGLPRRVAAYALSIIGTESAIDALVAELPACRDQNRVKYHDIAGPLCAAGHAPTIESILEKADKQGSTPGITSSGGEIALWEEAAFPEALAAARRRLDSVAPDRGIFLSMSRIGAFGDDSDIDRLWRIVARTRDISVLARAVWALSQLDLETGRKTAEEIWSQSSTEARGYFAHVYRRVTGNIDIKWALDVVSRGTLVDDSATNHAAVNTAAKLLADVQLERKERKRLADEFTRRTPANAWALWSVVKHHPFDEARDCALAAVTVPRTEEIGFACNYATECGLGASFHERFREALLVQLRGNHELLLGWEGGRAFAYLLTMGRREEVAALVEEALALVWGATDEEGGLRLQELIETASEVPELLKRGTVDRCLLGGDSFGGAKRESLVRLARQLAPSERDRILQKAASQRARARLLGVFSEFPQTSSNRALLESTLPSTLPVDRIAVGHLEPCIKNWWSDDMAAIVARALAKTEFRRDRGCVDSLLDLVAELITRRQFEQFVLPWITPDLHKVPRSIFKWWNQVTLYSRRDSE